MIKIQLEIAVAAIVLFILIIISLKKNSFSIKSSVAWLLLPIICLIVAIFPEPLAALASWLGFETLSNFIFLVMIGSLIILCFFLTVTISHQQSKITKLIQEVSLLKKESTIKNGKHDKTSKN